MTRSDARALVALSVLLPLAAALTVSFAVSPEDIESGRVLVAPACTFRLIFGRPCPTCGMTRAFAALSHGRLADALHYNGAAPILYGLFWAGVVVATVLVLTSAVERRKGSA